MSAYSVSLDLSSSSVGLLGKVTSSANFLAFPSDLGLLDDYLIFLGSLGATQIHIA